jgi:hypothetical protein
MLTSTEHFVFLLGQVIVAFGAGGVVLALGYMLIELAARLIRRGLTIQDMLEAVEEWRDKHPEKAAKARARLEKNV